MTKTARKIRVKVPVTIEVDLDAYANTYGLTPDQAAEDAAEHLTFTTQEAATEAIDRLTCGADVKVLR
jgi:hypothetical protein